MGEGIKTRLNNARNKLLRKNSTTTATSTTAASSTRSIASSAGSDRARQQAHLRTGAAGPGGLRKSLSLSKLPAVSSAPVADDEDNEQHDSATQRLSKSAVLLPATTTSDLAERRPGPPTTDDRRSQNRDDNFDNNTTTTASSSSALPAFVLEAPTPVYPPVKPAELTQQSQTQTQTQTQTNPFSCSADPAPSPDSEHPSELLYASSARNSSSRPTPPAIVRRQSLVTTSNARIIKTLLDPEAPPAAIASGLPTADYFSGATTFNAGMLHRKIWVKRPGASATLIQIREDDLVDDVREMVLKKYANSLGKTFDAPDLVLRIHPRDAHTSKTGDRLLGPEEDMCRTLDAYYPGGQSVNEALIIEVPQRRTPKPSPRIPQYYTHHDDSRPYENATEYFPPMPIINPSPAALAASGHDPRAVLPHAPHSIAVLQTGQLPPLPSPGSSRRPHGSRPKYPRHNTASPTALTAMPNTAAAVRPVNHARPRHDSSASDTKHSATSGTAPIPTPPAVPDTAPRQNSTPPTPRVSSPRPDKKRKKQKATEPPTLPAGLLDGSVPPINVLIVEDNIINLRVLGAFMQRLKVRWQRAMNGKEAVTKWRSGGFHLVLMDIQLPIMNGLEATKEIRRLERVNRIGVFSSGSSEAPNNRLGDDGLPEKEMEEHDKMGEKGVFKSPVIIVALTASSLQSDRHEALAAGCNDFLTKPVNFVWLERKVKEWGCMQALIDFDGWRKWKAFQSDNNSNHDGNTKLPTSYHSIARNKSNTSLSPTTANGVPSNGIPPAKSKDEEKKNKRKSLGVVPPPLIEEDSQGTPDLDSSGG